jgi:hypothetical protein
MDGLHRVVWEDARSPARGRARLEGPAAKGFHREENPKRPSLNRFPAYFLLKTDFPCVKYSLNLRVMSVAGVPLLGFEAGVRDDGIHTLKR